MLMIRSSTQLRRIFPRRRRGKIRPNPLNNMDIIEIA
jgi:hypothetical protein